MDNILRNNLCAVPHSPIAAGPHFNNDMKDDTQPAPIIKAGSTAAVAASAISFPTVTFGKPDNRKLRSASSVVVARHGSGGAGAYGRQQRGALVHGRGVRDRLDRSLANISKGREGKINVDDKRKFVDGRL